MGIVAAMDLRKDIVFHFLTMKHLLYFISYNINRIQCHDCLFMKNNYKHYFLSVTAMSRFRNFLSKDVRVHFSSINKRALYADERLSNIAYQRMLFTGNNVIIK